MSKDKNGARDNSHMKAASKHLIDTLMREYESVSSRELNVHASKSDMDTIRTMSNLVARIPGIVAHISLITDETEIRSHQYDEQSILRCVTLLRKHVEDAQDEVDLEKDVRLIMDIIRTISE